MSPAIKMEPLGEIIPFTEREQIAGKALVFTSVEDCRCQLQYATNARDVEAAISLASGMKSQSTRLKMLRAKLKQMQKQQS